MQLHGVHHVTAVTARVKDNVEFYAGTLGIRLVKKTVNQDDVSAYHLFYADKKGSPGTDMTFFDWEQMDANRRGADSISTTMFRVNGKAALEYWTDRFTGLAVKHSPLETVAGCAMLRFEDPENQRLALVDDGGAPFDGEPWDGSEVPVAHAIRGLYGVQLTVPQLSQIEPILMKVLDFKSVASKSDQPAETPGTLPHAVPAGMPAAGSGETPVVFGMDGGGPGKEVHVIEKRQAAARLGYGGVHHVAFRLRDDAEQVAWEQRLNSMGVGNSGIIDRFYFKSLYFRISNGILFELATDGPGFATDEPVEMLGKRLALPPFLEPRRKEIEARLKPI
jgi:glyoxalase family protein